MTHAELLEILQPTGIPWSYHHWDLPPELPYGVYLDVDDDPFFADDLTYVFFSNIRLELYSLERDPNLDSLVRDVLDSAKISYTASFAYIESEGLYETIFEIEV